MNGFETGMRFEVGAHVCGNEKSFNPARKGQHGIIVAPGLPGHWYVKWSDDGSTTGVKETRLTPMNIDVPSPPVAGKGVHAQASALCGGRQRRNQEGDHTMANPIKIETQLLIDGSPLKEFSDDSLFSIISEQEAAIKKYEAIANRPKALEAKIAAIQAGIAALVEAIDTRGPGDKPEA